MSEPMRTLLFAITAFLLGLQWDRLINAWQQWKRDDDKLNPKDKE